MLDGENVVEDNLPTPHGKAPGDDSTEATPAPRRRRRAAPEAKARPSQEATASSIGDEDPRRTSRRRPAKSLPMEEVPATDAISSPGSPAEPVSTSTRRRRTNKTALSEVVSDAQTNIPVADEAHKPTRRRRKPAVKHTEGKSSDEATPNELASEEASAPVQRIRRTIEPAAEAASTENAAQYAVPAKTEEIDSQGDGDSEGETLAPRRHRRGHRGGVGRRRQTPEQGVAGIPPSQETILVGPRPIDGRIADEWVRGDRAPAESLEASPDSEDWDSSEMKSDADHEVREEQRRERHRPARSLSEIDSSPSKTPDLSFMHPSEREFANLLDYYQIKFLYEPRSFPLRWDGNRVIEMHTPDFYLPEYDQYFELTTMKQSLVTQKNRKLRHVQEMYPEINIQLLYRRDLMRLMGKYGFGPLSDVDVTGTEQVLFSEAQVQQRVRELGKQIAEDYAGQEPLLIGVLRGVVVFMADLMRNIDLPIQIEFMEISHYGEEREETIEILRDVGTDIQGRPVIVIEDIVDTGLTLRYLLEHLQAKNPSSLNVCCLLDKSVRRMAQIPLNYIGFEIPDEFVIGYGLDYGGRYRNLPHIGVLKPQEPKTVAQR